MPIDFSQVEKITIPEGDVKSISVGGVVIWQEQSKVLTSITLSGQTTTITRGSAFTFGGTVTAHYSDSSTADVTSSTTFSGYNMSLGGTYTVTATYTEDGVTETATYTLTVSKKWSQIWSGSKTVTCNRGTASGTSSNFASTVASTGSGPRIRVTFSTTPSSAQSSIYQWFKNGSSQYSGPYSSPADITVSNNRILGVRCWDGTVYSDISLQRSTGSNSNINLSLTCPTKNDGSHSISLKVTKIEQYY